MPSTRPATTQTLLGSAVAAAARRLDRDHVARVEIDASPSPGARSPFSRLRPGAPSAPPRTPCGACARRSVISDSRQGSSTRSSRTTPSPPRCSPRAAGAEPQPVALDAQRVLQLERLDRRGERVRHRDVDARWPVRVGARALAAADRLVVREALVAERDVVHRPLPLGRARRPPAPKRGEDDVDDPARGLDVPRGDGRGRARVDEPALGRLHGHRRERSARTRGGPGRSGSGRRSSRPSA